MRQEDIRLSHGTKMVKCYIQLTGSKSECNRALIMQAISNGKIRVENISGAADTVTLANILRTHTSYMGLPQSDITPVIDVGPAGTAMRFLTALLSLQNGEKILTGTERMKQRPIGILAEALKKLGAEINYTQKDGYPPLKITGPLQQKTNELSVQGDISSQYISALLLIASSLPSGLRLTIEGELTSRPYVEMTLAMLEQAGIKHEWKNNVISIENQPFTEATIAVEPDWSAASYWYSIAALSHEAEIFLPGLNGYSLQGDSRITEIMANFGITSQFKNGGVFIKKDPKPLLRKIFDFKECPDLAQTVIVVCAALGHNATFTGLETLKIKETDRVRALQDELQKIGVNLIEKNQTYKLDCSGLTLPQKLTVKTYEDHRMAMAFAPLALVIDELVIEDYKVVEKSYPDFWNDLQKAGFQIK